MASYGIYPSDEFISVSPSDTVPLLWAGEAKATKGISVAVAGNVNIANILGTAVVIYLSAGIIHPIRTTLIKNTSTTATGIIAYF